MQKRKDYTELIDKDLCGMAARVPYNTLVVKIASILVPLTTGKIKPPDMLRVRSFTVKGFQNMDVPVEVIEPKQCEHLLPAALYVHGGAFSYKASAHHRELAFQYAQETPCKVIFPDYHLMPKFPYPAALQDALAVYRWMREQAAELGIDANYIAAAGDSAGAALVACLTNRCEREGVKPPCGQVLIYPVTDATMSTESMRKYVDTPLWNANNNRKMWQYYLKNKADLKEASPLQNELPSCVPPTYIEVTEYDCLHDEGVAYAEKLKAAGVDVTVNETYGTFHGYDTALKAEITKANVQQRIRFLKNVLSWDGNK